MINYNTQFRLQGPILGDVIVTWNSHEVSHLHLMCHVMFFKDLT